MRTYLASCLLFLVGCSRGGLGEGQDPPADLAASDLPGTDGDGTTDLTAPVDLALPPAEGMPLWGRTYAVEVGDVATAPDGSIYLAGTFGRANFGDGEVTSSGTSDGFVIKFDKLGQRQWAKTFGRAYSDVPTRVAADKDGNVAVVGYSLRTTDTGTHDAFVASYTAAGAQRFFRAYGGSTVKAVDTGIAAAYAADGSLWVTGGFEDRIDFGGGELVSAGDRDIYLLRLSATGAHLLSKRYGFTGYDQSSGVAVTPDGDLVVSGSGGYPIDFGDGNVGESPAVDSFLVRFAPDGKARWSKRFQLRPYSNSNVTAGADGAVWFFGDLNGSVDFGGGPRAPATGRGIFWARYSAAGAHLGSFVLPCNKGIYLNRAAVDSTGQIVLGGRVEGDIDFGAGNTTVADGYAFFFKSAADGRVRWARRLGGNHFLNDDIEGVAILPGDQIVVAGMVSKIVTLGAVSIGPLGVLLTLTP